MSLARAVTKRIKRSDQSPAPPARTQSVKNPSSTTMPIDRSKISLPVALLSTTNMLTYNAPDIATTKNVSSATSTHSNADDSDHSVTTARSRASSNGSRDTTLTDVSSLDSSPASSKPNHLSGFFPAGKQVRKSASATSLQQVKEEVTDSIPAIPQRAISHSKRAHERLAQKRSQQTIGARSSIGSLRNSREQRTSADVSKATMQEKQPIQGHPFGRELEQLNEIAEEFSGVVRDAETDADLIVMQSKNLATFCAADYLAEIRPLFCTRFGLPQQAPPMAWI